MELLSSGSRLEKLDHLERSINQDDLKSWEEQIRSVTVSTMLLEYLTDVLQASRKSEDFFGLSPRAGLDLLEAAKAWAFFENRNYVIPDDIQAVFPYVAGHRMFSQHALSAALEYARAHEFINTIPFVKTR